MESMKLSDDAFDYEDDADIQVSFQVEFESNKSNSSYNTNSGAAAFLESCGLVIETGDFAIDEDSDRDRDKESKTDGDQKKTPPQSTAPSKDNERESEDPTLKKAPIKLESKDSEDQPIDLKQDENWTKRKDAINSEIARLEKFISTISSDRVEAKQSTKRASDALIDWNIKVVELNRLRQEKDPESKDNQYDRNDGVQAKLVESLAGSNSELWQLDQRENALEIAVACLHITSGDDEQIRKGEKNLLTLVKRYPSLQQDGQFHDLVLKGYIEMAGARAARGLSPWKVELKLEDIFGDSKPKPVEKSSLALLKSANEKFWNAGIDEAVKDFNASLDAARFEKQETDVKRLTLFVSGLSKNVELAETVIKDKPDEELLKAKINQCADEKKLAGQSVEKSNFIDSVAINSSLAKIACGDSVRFVEGIDELKQQFSKSPKDALEKEFLENLNQALAANLENAQNLKDKNKNNDEKDKLGYKDLDFAKVKDAAPDTQVESYLADNVTTAALTLLGLALTVATTRRTIARLKDQRVLNDLYEAKPLDGLPKNSPFNLRNGDGTETKLEYKGRFDTSDRVILRDANCKDDWKKRQAEGFSAGSDFDLKEKNYGDYERLRVDGRDFFVDKANKVHVEKKGQMHPTSEIRVLTNAQFEQLRNTDGKPVSGDGKTSAPIALVAVADSSEPTPKIAEQEKFPKTLAEVSELARKTDSHATAQKCVDWLVKARPEGFVNSLFDLAKSDSCSAIPALQALADRPDSSSEACKLVMDRWNSGDFLSLIKENKVDLMQMQVLFLSEKIVAPDIWKEAWMGLADSPEARGKLARLFLISVEFEESRHWTIDVSDELRQRAFDFVVENRLPNFEATLAGAANMRQSGLSDRAAGALERLWTSDTQPEKGIAKSKFMVGDLIKKFSESAKQLQWTDTAFDIERTLRDHQQVRIEIEASKKALTVAASEEVVKFIETNYQNPQMVREKLEKESYFEEANNLLELTAKQKELKDTITKVRESRQNDLQKFANEFCKNNGLPKVNLEVRTFSRTALGSYSSGDSCLTVVPKLVMGNGGVQPALAKVLLHELGHHEQTALIACKLADDLGIEKEASLHQVTALLALYKEKTGRPLDFNHAQQTLNIRNGEQLSQTETARATELIIAKKDHVDQVDNEKMVKELSKKLTDLKAGLESEIPVEDVLKLQTEEAAKSLLAVEHLPEKLSKALSELSEARSRESAFAEAVALADLRVELVRAINERLIELSLKSHGTYRKRFHEQETHAIDERTAFFSNPTNPNLDISVARSFASNHPILSLPNFQNEASDAVSKSLDNSVKPNGADKLTGQSKRDVKSTVSELERSFKEMLKRHNLPGVTLQETSKIPGNLGNQSNYLVGKGVIQLSSELLANGSAEQITHELRRQYVRFEQDRLVLMNAIEQNHDRSDKECRFDYETQSGTFLDDKFFESVKAEFTARSDGGRQVVLDEHQILYAEEIGQSLSRLNSDLGKLSLLEGQQKTLTDVKNSLGTKSGTIKILATLAEEQGKTGLIQLDESISKTLFPDGKIPEPVQGLIDKYKKASASGADIEKNGWTADSTNQLKSALEEVCKHKEQVLEVAVTETKQTISNNKLNVESAYGNYHDLAAIRPADDAKPDQQKESHSTRVLDLQTQAAQTKVEDAERALELRQSEVIQKVLKEAGMEERKAKELERRLTSTDEKERESAVREINKHFEEKVAASESASDGSKTGKDGKVGEEKRLSGWKMFESKLRANKGRLATVVILTGPIVGSLMRQENNKDPFKGSTFSK